MAYVSQESICKTLITDANKAMKRGDLTDAEKLLLEAVGRLESATGPVHPRIAAVLLRLGDFYCLCRRFTDAENQFRRAMSIYESTFGDDNLDVAICLQHLAESLEAQQRGSEALCLRERSKTILSRRLDNFGFQPVPRAS
ncbi:MAG TPA: tetratricopeptide repeat protein [Candidatus Obscuribacterales bacterium]